MEHLFEAFMMMAISHPGIPFKRENLFVGIPRLNEYRDWDVNPPKTEHSRLSRWMIRTYRFVFIFFILAGLIGEILVGGTTSA